MRVNGSSWIAGHSRIAAALRAIGITGPCTVREDLRRAIAARRALIPWMGTRYRRVGPGWLEVVREQSRDYNAAPVQVYADGAALQATEDLAAASLATADRASIALVDRNMRQPRTRAQWNAFTGGRG